MINKPGTFELTKRNGVHFAETVAGQFIAIYGFLQQPNSAGPTGCLYEGEGKQ
jgi:hypothetical protein